MEIGHGVPVLRFDDVITGESELTMNRNEVEKIICGVRDLAAKKGTFLL